MRLANVNTSDIRAAVELGCRTMSSVFNADDNDIPFFASEVRPNPHLAWNEVHSESHVPGRHLNALLAAESALGIEVSPTAIAKHTAAAYFSYSGPLPLPLNRIHDIAQGNIKTVGLSPEIIIEAVNLLDKGYLTPMDSVQLATAIQMKLEKGNLVFVCSDKKLGKIAQKYGIKSLII